MSTFLSLPLEIRLVALALLGAVIGSLVNLGTYRLGWHTCRISPWWQADPAAPRRRAVDRVPIIGWLGLRREASLHGPGFWIRPLAVELGMAAALPALYVWEVVQGRLLPVSLGPNMPPAALTVLHVQYLSHVILIALLILAALIDIDEKTIPDAVTLPGALVGLTAATVYPWAMLPVLVRRETFIGIEPMRFTSPLDWPAGFAGYPSGWSLLVALVCWWLWCVALMPRNWYTRHGLGRAVRLCLARLAREPASWWLAALGTVGSVLIAAVWFRGGAAWSGLLTALVGLAAGGAMVWVVRNVGTAVLQREAMGFGDVTLMAMIGAFLGWQSCLIIFFLAPFAGLVVGLIVLVLRRDTEIPYGPFLCLATVGLLLFWPSLWLRTQPLFGLGLMVPVVLAGCAVVLAVLLCVVQLVKRAVA